MSNRAKKIFLIAGEPSGDHLGARLMAQIRKHTSNSVTFVGIGGPEMESEGLISNFPMRELSVMGFLEVLPHIPRIFSRIRQTVTSIKSEKPDILVTIDSPGFSNQVVSALGGYPIIKVHYVAPTVWAWRPWRVHKYKKNYDMLLALLPFEPSYFQRVGLQCQYVGHPVLEYGADQGDGIAFRLRHGISEKAIVLCVLPGSRKGEVRRLAPVFGAVLDILLSRGYNFHVFIPTVQTVEQSLLEYIKDWPTPVTVLRSNKEKYDLMAASDAALAASGTVSLELALAKVPTVIAYKVASLTAPLLRLMIRVRFANLINIILNEKVVPERIQQFCKPSIIADDIETLLDHNTAQKQLAAVAPALKKLSVGSEKPSSRAAQAILNLLQLNECTKK